MGTFLNHSMVLHDFGCWKGLYYKKIPEPNVLPHNPIFVQILKFWNAEEEISKAACFDLGLGCWKVYPGIIRSILYQSLQHFHKITLMMYLHKLAYIKSYRGFLFQLSNGQKIVYYSTVHHLFQLTSANHVTYHTTMADDWMRLVSSPIKNCKYID